LVELRKREGVAAQALEFTILTAARTGDVLGAKWDEIDFQTKTWLIPAGRMKGGRQHKVPLSTSAVALLKSLYTVADNEHVFIGGRNGGLSGMSLSSVLLRMKRTDITVHGFRSTFRDWAAERSSFPNHVIEMALAHVVGNKVEAAYRRGDLFDKRRKLMDAWASYCESKPIKAGEVVPLRAAT
jgi:integrase